MKKVFLALVAVIAIGTSTTFAQKAIGLRLGGGSLLGAEVSYQQDMGSNRLEADLGLGLGAYSTHLSVAGIYQWKWNIVDALNWYAGPAVGVGIHLSDNEYYSGLSLGVGGQVGIEYNFNKFGVPLLVSFDVRPIIDLVHPKGYDLFGWGTCASVRYLF